MWSMCFHDHDITLLLQVSFRGDNEVKLELWNRFMLKRYDSWFLLGSSDSSQQIMKFHSNFHNLLDILVLESKKISEEGLMNWSAVFWNGQSRSIDQEIIKLYYGA